MFVDMDIRVSDNLGTMTLRPWMLRSLYEASLVPNDDSLGCIIPGTQHPVI
jgi:hypothetical protein